MALPHQRGRKIVRKWADPTGDGISWSKYEELMSEDCLAPTGLIKVGIVCATVPPHAYATAVPVNHSHISVVSVDCVHEPRQRDELREVLLGHAEHSQDPAPARPVGEGLC